MAKIQLSTFSGILPQVSPRLLPEQHATIAENVLFERGRLSGIRSTVNANDHNSVSFTVPVGTKTIYRHRDRQGNGYWLAWDEHVHAAPSPIAEDPYDRLYWTGQSYPRLSLGTEVATSSNPFYDPSTSRKLGIPNPTEAPTASIVTPSTDETLTPASRAYVYTWVSGLGEESGPSPASSIIDVKSDEMVTVTPPPSVPSYIYNTQSAPAKKRIYRTNVNGEFQFVGELMAYEASLVDSKLDEALGEIIPTDGWSPPPDNSASSPDGPLLGLTAMPNGMLAGFAGRSVFFAEQFMPHAWPKAYSLTVKSKVVGLTSISIGLMVLTQGKPVLMTGSSPAGMGAVEIDNDQACVSARSIVDMGDVAVYASPDGLVAAGENGVNLVTEGVFTREQWQALKPESIHAYKFEGRYVFF